jgi:hypothetical protein
MISFSFVKSAFLSLQGARKIIKKQCVAKETDKLIYLKDWEITRTRTELLFSFNKMTILNTII